MVGGPLPEFVLTCVVEEVPLEALPPGLFGVTLMLVWVWVVEPPIPEFMDFPTVLPDPENDPDDPEVLPEVGVWPLPELPGGPAAALTQLPPESRTWPEGHVSGWPWPWLP